MFGGKSRETTDARGSARSHETQCGRDTADGDRAGIPCTGLSATVQGSAETAALRLHFCQGFLGQQQGTFIPSRDLQYYSACDKKLILHTSVCLALEL